jgi:hypothetical protein
MRGLFDLAEGRLFGFLLLLRKSRGPRPWGRVSAGSAAELCPEGWVGGALVTKGTYAV